MGTLVESLGSQDDGEVRKITWKLTKSHNGAHILRKLFSMFIKEIVEGMIGYVRLPTIMLKLLSDNGSQEFGDFRLTILEMLGTYDFERRILDTAKSLIEDDTFYTMSLLKKGASHGFSPRSLLCCICSCLLSKTSSGSTIRVFNCGHAIHLQCELQEKEASRSGSSAGCPICLPKKRAQRSKNKSVLAENGLVSKSLTKHQLSQGNMALPPMRMTHLIVLTARSYSSISRFDILTNLQKDHKMIQIENMPQLRLAPPAVYHEKVKKGISILRICYMATLTAPKLVLRSNVNNASATCMREPKPRMVRIGFRNQTMSHQGLRFLNNVDELHIRTMSKVATQQVRGKKLRNPCAVVISASGMNLIFVGSEVAPWSKTGGLGDVLGGLPPAMAANGHRVMTVSPRYDQYKDAWDTEVVIELQVGDKTEKVRFFHCYKRGVDRVFVDHPMFLQKVWGKTGSKVYGPVAGIDYKDNQLRFSLLCQAALEAPRVLNLNSNKYFSGPYGEDVVFIANDWHTALLPCYLKSMYKPKGIYASAKVAFCIHNIAYQGRFAFADFALLNLPDEFKSSFDFMDGYDKPVKGRKINWMKAGIIESHITITVSPHYAKELISGEDKGVELDNILRREGVLGIVNGMDTQEWNPLTDKYTSIKYDASTVRTAITVVSRVEVTEAKPLLKEALQAAVGLKANRNIPVIGFIGRLEEQKGSDILAEAIPQFINEDVQIIVLGTGKKVMEKQLEELEIKYPEKARGVAKFSVPLAHGIISGADFLLVPSRFEPCGLIQLQAMRYGTVCIVASTGGLVDTIKEGYTGFQMGAFNVECDRVDPADVTAIATTVKRALATYGTPVLAEMIQNCMAQELSWKGPAKKWEEALLSLGVAGSEPGIEGEEIAPLAKENVATP
ncbi:hypothetical protein RJ639_013236 [Escallonia herrerae]|uniref:Granule-bound starch synthase 1, chloroplastic/amyloplastic n=1 Tax=Escallonia herrerae TaxID=1293975 RepID=A0AA89AMP7_9ASTE|nr:hypothetical protein RJ639_013236 [Escallonia herrerae]